MSKKLISKWKLIVKNHMNNDRPNKSSKIVTEIKLPNTDKHIKNKQDDDDKNIYNITLNNKKRKKDSQESINEKITEINVTNITNNIQHNNNIDIT
jgi:hypothetical protein